MAGRIHDISLPLGGETPVYPGDPSFVRELLHSHREDGFELSRLTMGAHVGTHVDAPAHFLPEGKRLDEFPPDRFLLDALVVDVPGKGHVRAEDFDLESAAPGQAVLFRTDNSASGTVVQCKFTKAFLALTPSAAHKCVEAAVGLVGIDAPSIDPADSGPEAHRILLGSEILLLEGADLRNIAPGRYRLVCLPLRVRSAEGSPVRAVLIED